MRRKVILASIAVVIIIVFLLIFLIKPFFTISSAYETGYENRNKVVDVAVAIGSPLPCNFIYWGQDHDDYKTGASENRLYCKVDYASKSGDVDYCRTLPAKSLHGAIAPRIKCLRSLAGYHNDSSLCDEIKRLDDHNAAGWGLGCSMNFI